ncbi:MAG: Fur family transcriptional regulator [Sulfolobaceae archaeon]|nr:Fur family transcriptional regulator [Sulfolobaceae archaeon]
MEEKELVEFLRQKGLKVTPQRLAVLKLLSKGGHFTGEQIYDEIKRVEPSISLSTVYNALEALEEAGLINSFEANGVTWYELRKEPHINVICLDTNEIIDINTKLDTIYEILKNQGINVKAVNVVAYAECSNLQKESQTASS